MMYRLQVQYEKRGGARVPRETERHGLRDADSIARAYTETQYTVPFP